MKKLTFSCNNHVSSFSREDAMNPKADYEEVLSADPINIPAGNYKFIFDYPLSREAHFQYSLTPEMSIIDILLLAKADYQAIYAAEEATAGNPGHIPGMLNRQSSDGPYGIWGHDMEDLYFESVEVDSKKMTVEFGIGS